MLDPTHKAIMVWVHRCREIDIEVGVGPDFAIGKTHPTKGTRLLMAEVKTSSIEATDRAIYNIATKDHEFTCCYPDSGAHYSIHNWIRIYEETQVHQGLMNVEDCVFYGKI